MNVSLIAIGRLKDPALTALYEEYKKRFEWKISLTELSSKSTPDQESTFILNHLSSSSYIITLDERGEALSSAAFAELLKTIQLHHQGRATFIIGGADGLSQEIKEKGQKSLSFGRMTWPHLLVRVMLMEQLYRAQQILKGHPYHRE